MSEEKCETCRFWEPGYVNRDDAERNISRIGLCLRYPPQIPTRTSQMAGDEDEQCCTGIWPETSYRSWCGEWQSSEMIKPLPVVDPPVLSMPLHMIEWDVRIRKAFNKLQLVTVRDLIAKSPDELLAVKNFGITCLWQVRGQLAQRGLFLRDDDASHEAIFSHR